MEKAIFGSKRQLVQLEILTYSVLNPHELLLQILLVEYAQGGKALVGKEAMCICTSDDNRNENLKAVLLFDFNFYLVQISNLG